VRRRIAFLAAALVAGLGVAVYRKRKMEEGEARLRSGQARRDGGNRTVAPTPTQGSAAS
jgi:hypothetical protein